MRSRGYGKLRKTYEKITEFKTKINKQNILRNVKNVKISKFYFRNFSVLFRKFSLIFRRNRKHVTFSLFLLY